MRRRLAPALAAALLAGLATGCTAAYDGDGELRPPGDLAPIPAKRADAVDVVVDTDLAPDDLVALAYLLRHPGVRVHAITVPTTGLVNCPVGIDLAHDLMTAVDVSPVPISCGTNPRGPQGIAFPRSWSYAAASDSGLTRIVGTWNETTPASPPELIGRLAAEHPGLQVIALGPATELAAMLRTSPRAYGRIARIVAMTGVVTGPPQDDTAGEWNAAADPDSLAAVLAGPVPVTVVPHEVVPEGQPAGVRAPVVGGLGVLTPAPTPRFWDLATAGYFTEPATATTVSASLTVDLTGEPGRLTRTGPGPHEVVTSLDAERLDAAYADVFAVDPPTGRGVADVQGAEQAPSPD